MRQGRSTGSRPSDACSPWAHIAGLDSSIRFSSNGGAWGDPVDRLSRGRRRVACPSRRSAPRPRSFWRLSRALRLGQPLVSRRANSIIDALPHIVLYVVDKYREKGLLPASLEAKANVYRWTMFAVTELEQPFWRSASTQHFLRKISACRRTLHSREKSFSLWRQFSILISKGVDSLLAITSRSRIASPRILSTGPTNCG